MNWISILVVVFACLCYSGTAAAYLDPGAGSFMLQMLIAGIMGLVLTLKLYWYKLKAFLARLLGKTPAVNPDRPTDQESDDG
jgi:hypothetical protein